MASQGKKNQNDTFKGYFFQALSFHDKADGPGQEPRNQRLDTQKLFQSLQNSRKRGNDSLEALLVLSATLSKEAHQVKEKADKAALQSISSILLVLRQTPCIVDKSTMIFISTQVPIINQKQIWWFQS